MVLFDQHRAALFTGEGKAVRDGQILRLGPLELNADPACGSLNFHGTAVVVNDGAAYLSVEKALAEGRLDQSMELSAALDFPDAGDSGGLLGEHFARVLAGAEIEDHQAVPAAIFGHLRGSIMIEGKRRAIDAVARMGFSFTGFNPSQFATRRMLWASFPGNPAAAEARLLTFGDAPDYRSLNLLGDGGWREGRLEAFALDTPATGACPNQLSAVFIHSRDDSRHRLEGQARNYMTLSRPGFNNARIHTSLGFATFQLEGQAGAGMFEYSRIVAPGAAADEVDADSD
jgi:hypothetical protein